MILWIIKDVDLLDELNVILVAGELRFLAGAALVLLLLIKWYK